MFNHSLPEAEVAAHRDLGEAELIHLLLDEADRRRTVARIDDTHDPAPHLTYCRAMPAVISAATPR